MIQKHLKHYQTASGLSAVQFALPFLQSDIELAEAIKLGAPSTTQGSRIWELDEAEPKSAVAGKMDYLVTLLFLGRAWQTSDAAEHAESRMLPVASTRQILAIGEHYPDLNYQLESRCMAIVRPTPYPLGDESFEAWLWFSNTTREAHLTRLGGGFVEHSCFAVLGDVP
jgi:hypothetical protein